MARWKGVELEIAKALGARRAGAVGKEGPDILDCEPYAPQVKHGKTYKLAKWLHLAWDQAEGDADGLIPVLIIHEKYADILDSFVIMRLSDFREQLTRCLTAEDS